MNYNLNLRTQLLALFLIFAILPSFVIVVMTVSNNQTSVNSSQTQIEKLQLSTLSGLADQYADIVNNYVHEETKTVDAIANDPLIRMNIELLANTSTKGAALSRMSNLFNNWIVTTDGISEMMLLNYTTGDVILSLAPTGSSNSSNNKASDSYFLGAKSTTGATINEDSVYFKDIYLSTTTNTYEMAFSHSVRPYTSDSATPTGILVTRVDPSILWQEIAPRDSSNQPVNSYYQSIGLGKTGEIYLMNDQGMAISRSRHNLNDNQFILKEDLSQTQGFKDAIAYGYRLGKGSDYEGNSVFGVYVYLGAKPTTNDTRASFLKSRLDYDLHWVLGIDINISEVMTPAYQIRDQLNNSLFMILGVIGLMAAIVVIISLFISNSFSKPIVKLSKVSQSIADGDLSVEIQESKKEDEIGDLEKAFATMVNFLKPSIESISDVAKTLAASAQEMASSSEEVNASSEEMSSVSQQISKGAQQQTEYLSKSMKQMEDIQKQFSEKIGGIKIASDLIESISSQVNMLALNASIEAARAGEYGRGFAVVADNIRRLADDAKSSVDKVNAIIEDLTVTITGGMDALSSSVTSVTSVAEETASGAEEASAATEEQAATMEELSASAQELAKVSIDLEEIVRKFKIN